ncbi:hypothetical protein GQ55_1G407500 [Panicum hallii var. hallii]|uniref:Uncharacterized protein n=1 Tax=Panicum hallii var. hallii TaxID=1504633 RepID=A0A2T7FCR5_9POAL|nr:hypothetical protein GQ55_1G407500 [Panicum hallii var. hallii]
MITKPSVKGYFILVSEFTETYKKEQTCLHKRSQACPAHFQKRKSQEHLLGALQLVLSVDLWWKDGGL